METGRQPNPVSELRENWYSLRKAQRLKEFRGLPAHQMAELFVRLDTASQAKLLQALDIDERRVWLRQLPSDDAVDLIQATAPEKRGALLAALDDRSRHEIQALLAYRSDVAGGLMDPRFARLRPELKIDEAIAYLRKQAPIVRVWIAPMYWTTTSISLVWFPPGPVHLGRQQVGSRHYAQGLCLRDREYRSGGGRKKCRSIVFKRCRSSTPSGV